MENPINEEINDEVNYLPNQIFVKKNRDIELLCLFIINPLNDLVFALYPDDDNLNELIQKVYMFMKVHNLNYNDAEKDKLEEYVEKNEKILDLRNINIKFEYISIKNIKFKLIIIYKLNFEKDILKKVEQKNIDRRLEEYAKVIRDDLIKELEKYNLDLSEVLKLDQAKIIRKLNELDLI